ncbi:MAG: tRNA threonylcarbamoyladenosine dehydratase [Myxococcota bacterium]
MGPGIRPMHPFHRTELLVGGEGHDRLVASSACVIGLGGVGSYAAEALARSGIGRLVFVDFDKVCITNVNRQLHATRRTVRQFKADLMVERAAQINPKADVVGMRTFYEPETAEAILGEGYDIVLDCIDNMTAKVHLLQTCIERDQPVISAMGAGGRMDPTRLRVTDIAETRKDPFARIVRQLLRERGITEGVTCVWSDEPPHDLDQAAESSFRCICPDKSLKDKHSCEGRHQVQGTVPWMPAMFGLTMAGVAVHQILDRPIAERPRQVRLKPTAKPSRAEKQRLLRQAGYGREEIDGGPNAR